MGSPFFIKQNELHLIWSDLILNVIVFLLTVAKYFHTQ